MRSLAGKNTALALFLVQLIFIIVFAAVGEYEEIVTPRNHRDSDIENEPIRQYYASSGAEERGHWQQLRKRYTLQRLMNFRSGKHSRGRRKKDPALALALVFVQGTLLCAYITGFVVYHPHADAADKHNSVHSAYGGLPQHKNILRQHDAMFQDVHVMVVVGFGFLMVFLRKYGYSSVSFTLVMTAVMIQWAMIFQGVFNTTDRKIQLSIKSMLDADVATAAVLISMGAVLGRTTPLQLLVMGIFQIILYSVNLHLCTTQMQSADLGGSMVVHVYGAYFGLAVSRALGPPTKLHDDETSHYGSDILAMIGTTFLWVFWPSFNGVGAIGHSQHRAVLNTYLALAASCVTAMASSALFGKFKIMHVQNATLAGGVAVGAVADLMLSPAGALAVGAVAGILAVIGYAHLQPLLLRCVRLHDTCGVHNLHGMPGVVSGIISAIMAAIADEEKYKNSLYQIYPARAPPANSSQLGNILEEFHIGAGLGRSAGTQSGYQILALVSSLGFGLCGGAITGLILREERLFRQVSWRDMFGDALHWDLPEELTTVTSNPPLPQVLAGSDNTGSQRNPQGPATEMYPKV